MANLTELSQWETGIYQLETTDPVEAGSGGISNEQARLLGNRTKWIKDNAIFPLRKATVSIGDVEGTTDIRTISFPNLGTSSYMVLGTLVSKSTNYQIDVDVLFQIREKTNTSFKICLREFDSDDQNLDFDYIIIPF